MHIGHVVSRRQKRESKELVVRRHRKGVFLTYYAPQRLKGERSIKMAFEPITTQEQLDKVIGERIAGVKAKYEGFDDYKKKAEDYDALKEKADGLEQQAAALNKEINGDDKNPGYKKMMEETQSRLKGYETSSLKMRVAHENGIPFELADKLSGSDEEAIKKDAEIMAKFLRKRDVPPLAGGDPQKMDDKKTAMKNMLANLKGE